MNKETNFLILKTVVISVCISIFLSFVLVSCVKYFGKSWNPCEEHLKLKYNETLYELSESVQTYIDSVAPNSALSAFELVNACVEADIDICFVLAQGQKESHFGTQGLARKTNSVWNVYAYDGLKHDEIHKKGKYKHPNESIEPYLNLLNTRYLTNKTEYDLLDKFVDKNGNRYASAPEYESALRSIYSDIKNNTQIDNYSQKLKKYSVLLGK